MKAVITDGKGKVWVDEAPEPEVGEYDALVRIEACAFCNSTDRHIVDATLPFGSMPYPVILGHESVGVVERVGPGVRSFEVGRRVLRPYAMYPGDSLGRFGSGWGGFAAWGKVLDRRAMIDDGRIAEGEHAGLRYQLPVPEDVETLTAVMMIALREAVSACYKVDPIEGQRFLLAGAGAAGCLIASVLRLKGGHVTLTARREEALEQAMRLGAADDVRLLDDADGLAKDYDALVETTGSIEVASRLTDHVRADGRIYSYAVYEGMTAEGFFDDLAARRDFRRIGPDEAQAHDEACRLVAEGCFDLPAYVTWQFSIDEAEAAWRTVTGKRTLKTVVRFPR